MPLEASLSYSDGITGENSIVERADSSPVFEYNHEVYTPVDTQAGTVQGARVHGVSKVVKPVDTASAPLFQALCTGQRLEALELHFFRVNSEDGTMEEFWTVAMANVKVTAIRPMLPSSKDPATEKLPMLETVDFLYEDITWTHMDGLEFKDSWSGE